MYAYKRRKYLARKEIILSVLHPNLEARRVSKKVPLKKKKKQIDLLYGKVDNSALGQT